MFSNKYIFIYASAMVIIVAAILSSASQILKPFQEKNIRTEKIMEILKSVNIKVEKSEAEELYAQYIVEELAVNKEGEVVGVYKNGKFELGDVRAFDVELKKEQKKRMDLEAGKSTEEPVYPIFICNKEGKNYFIIPLLGKGLWGPIWGNIAFEEDFNTVYGATFGHKGETPGLGAEIDKADFQQQFFGKTIFDEGHNFKSVKVVKGGVSALPQNDQIHGVDAISGGTITSNGLSDMLNDCLINYVPYINKNI